MALKELPRYDHTDYTVVCICDSLTEFQVAFTALDKIHGALLQPPEDTNIYTLGSTSSGNTVVLLRGCYGFGKLFSTFPNIKIELKMPSEDVVPISPYNFLTIDPPQIDDVPFISHMKWMEPSDGPILQHKPSWEFTRKYDGKHDKTPKEWFVPGMINKIPADACPDTGSCINAISLDFAREQGWPVRSRPNLPRIKLPGNRSIRPLGVLTLRWRFAKESHVYDVDFYILRRCVYPVILGRDFLISSMSFRKWPFRSRFRKKDVEPQKRKRLCFLGSAGHRTPGALNGHDAWALADTGSDVMIVSRNFARSLQLDIDTGDSHREWLEFADGSRRRADGVVLGAEWNFGVGSRKYRDDFFVLDGIGTDIILSSSFILENDLFSTHKLFEPQYDVSQTSIVDFSHLNLIKRLGNRSKQPSPSAISDDLLAWTEDDEQEHVRRANAEDLINKLSEEHRESAWKEEYRKRTEWDQRRASSRASAQVSTHQKPQLPSPKPNRKFRIMLWGKGRQKLDLHYMLGMG